MSWPCWYIAGACDHHACGVDGGFLPDDDRREPGPTTEDYCGSEGHVYYGDDSGHGRCYCGVKEYPARRGSDPDA